MKFRKKPVVIEAIQWNGDPDEVFDWARTVSDGNGTSLHYIIDREGFTSFIVRTLEGDMTANIGDMIICGVSGEFYFCRLDIFEKTYEAVE
jgi:hypothetical protein